MIIMKKKKNEHSRNFEDDDVATSSIRYDDREERKNGYIGKNGSRVQVGAHTQRSRRNRQAVSDHNFLFFFFFSSQKNIIKKHVLWLWVHHVSTCCTIWEYWTQTLGVFKKDQAICIGQ